MKICSFATAVVSCKALRKVFLNDTGIAKIVKIVSLVKNHLNS